MIVRALAVLGLLPTLLFALTSAPAGAASFDCSKASTAYERAICTNPDLSALDDQLGVAFATATGGLTKPVYAQMLENQRSWVKYAERACTENAEPQKTDYTEDQHNCLHSNLFNRIRDLEQSRMLSGWRFYMVERFIVMPADQDEGSSFNTIATKVYSSPRIDGSDTTASEFNAFAEALLESVMASADGGGPDDRSSDVDTRLKVTAATSSRITVTVNDWWYGHGAAHGNYTITYAHFLVADGRPLTADDVFAGEGWVEALSELAEDTLKASLGENMWDDVKEQIARSVADPSRWNFSEEGLILQFQPYEVTAYAAGAPSVTIPWGALETYTTDTIYGVAAY